MRPLQPCVDPVRFSLSLLVPEVGRIPVVSGITWLHDWNTLDYR
jgi:hypothetical protein